MRRKSKRPPMPRHHTLEELKEIFAYDPLTGLLSWKKPRKGVKPGQVVGTQASYRGCLRERVFIKILLDGKQYLAHTLAWAITHGEWPGEVWHLDDDATNNKLDNLVAGPFGFKAAERRHRLNVKTSGADYMDSLHWRESSYW